MFFPLTYFFILTKSFARLSFARLARIFLGFNLFYCVLSCQTGVAKLKNALETMKTQQAEDTKKKQQLEKLCKNEGAIQSEKQRVLSQHIQDNMKNVSILETNLKTSELHCILFICLVRFIFCML